jgi:hypothetical protein
MKWLPISLSAAIVFSLMLSIMAPGGRESKRVDCLLLRCIEHVYAFEIQGISQTYLSGNNT